MAIGGQARGPLWVDGRLAVRVRGPGPDPGRVVRVRRPFALIGQIPGADVRIDDPAVDGRHALLILDRRGVFGVDLLSRSGTRFAGSAADSAWLGAGDILEVAGRRVELLRLRVDGEAVDPPLSVDDPLAVADPSELVGLTLEPLDSPGPPWMLGSALAFVGRGEACAIRIENAAASRTHCALLRGPSAAYAIDLLGRRTLLNDRPIGGASALLDGDVLTLGRARFAVRVEAPREPAPGPRQATLATVTRPVAAGPTRDPSAPEVLDALRQFQADAATMLGAQVERIEALDREIASLRDEIRGHRGTIVPRRRLDLGPPSGPSEGSASWLLDRLDALEAEGRSTWKDLLGRITSTVVPRPARGPSPDDRS